MLKLIYLFFEEKREKEQLNIIVIKTYNEGNIILGTSCIDHLNLIFYNNWAV